MTDLRKAAEMALEFLEHVDRFDPNGRYGLDEKIDALIQALAQPEQEPVAWIRSGDDQLSLVKVEDDGYMVWKPLYTAPPSKPDVNQELVEALNTILWTRAPNKNPSRYAHTVEEIAFRALAKHDKLKEQA